MTDLKQLILHTARAHAETAKAAFEAGRQAGYLEGFAAARKIVEDHFAGADDKRELNTTIADELREYER